MCLQDLYFLLRYGLNRPFVDNDWWFARCREVQFAPNGYLDLWFREGGKSTIITIALTIQDILRDPEITVGIFSHTKSIAKSFLRVIKREFESNELLKGCFPDVLYKDPVADAPKWSEDAGIIVMRKGNPPEATVESHGLVDGMPTGRHFQLRVYDDCLTSESVSTPEQMRKVIDAMDMSSNLGRKGGIMRMIGTRYKLGDAYEEYIKRGVVKPRIYPATDNGRVDGTPVYHTEEEWELKLQNMSPAIIASQMLQNPLAEDTVIFQPDWIRMWPAYLENDDGSLKRDDRGQPIPNELPDFEMIFLSLDGAFSAKTSADDSCLLALGVFKANEGSPKFSVMILDCYMQQVNYPTLRDEVLRQYQNKFGLKEKVVDGIIVEDKSSGSALIPELRNAGIPVYPYNPGKLDKIARANLVSHLVRDGYLWIPESDNLKRRGYPKKWLSKWHEQMLYFPNVAHDDGVDSAVMGLAVLDKMGFLRGKSAPPRQLTYWERLARGSYSGDAVNTDGY
jgi:predicted phage terminase large subunit-like protein